MGVPFVGRAEELDRIRALGRAITVDRRPSALVFVGEPGLGKSRLLAEAQSAVGVRNRLSIVGYEPERNVPLAAAADLLRTLVRADPGGRLGEFLTDPTRTAALEPIRVFEAAHRTSERLLPFIILVDDLQWVDELSLALCHYLLRAAVSGGRAVGLLAASRPSPVVGSFIDALGHVLGDTGELAVSELAPLDHDDGIRLARALAPDVDSKRAAQLWSEADGSPFWLSVLAGGGADRGADRIIDLRLRSTGSDAAEVVALLTVAGRPTTIDEIASVAGWPEPRVEAALDELGATGLATRTGRNASLVHDLVRAAADRRLPADTRRRLHRAWSETLEHGAAGDLGTLRSALEHRRAAGMPSVDLALRLARSPRRRWLGSEGLALVAAIADEAEPSDASVQELQEATAALASELGEDRVAHERWTLLGDRLPPGVARERALLGAARAAYELNLMPATRLAIERARAEASGFANRIALDALEAEVVIWLEARPTDGWLLALRAAAQAKDLVNAAGSVDRLPVEDRRAVIDAARVAFQAAVQDDRWRDLHAVAQAYFAAAQGFDGAEEIRGLLAEAVASALGGEYGEALIARRRAWEESHRRVYPSVAVEAGLALADTSRVRGEIGVARDVVKETLDLVDRIGMRGRLVGRFQLVVHDVAFHMGERRTAIEGLVRAAAQLGAHYALAAHEMLASWLALLDGPVAATEVVASIEAGRTCAAAAGCPRCGLELELWAAQALIRIGRLSEARNTVAAWDAARPDPNADDRLTRAWVEGLLAAEQSDSARAVDLLTETFTEAERQGRRTDAIGLQLDLGRVLAGTDSEAAAEWFSRAGADAKKAGSVALERLAERGLRELGVRTWRRGPARRSESSPGPSGPETAGLSLRELEVARLVTEGASNPEIAAQLFLSRKTVERHVSNALAKVGARNRTELARRLREIDASG